MCLPTFEPTICAKYISFHAANMAPFLIFTPSFSFRPNVLNFPPVHDFQWAAQHCLRTPLPRHRANILYAKHMTIRSRFFLTLSRPHRIANACYYRLRLSPRVPVGTRGKEAESCTVDSTNPNRMTGKRRK